MKPQFTEHDRKLWSDMAVLCDRFLRHEVGMQALVTGLQGLLDAGEFGDKELREQWYSLWLPLEIRNATGEAGWSPDAAGEVRALRAYISDALKSDAAPAV